MREKKPKSRFRRAFQEVLGALALQAIPLLALVLRLLLATCRYRWVGYAACAERHRRGAPVIYAFWHGRMLPFVYTHRGRSVHVLISEHRDGEIIARLIGRFGFRSVRGSTTHGGLRAFVDLVRAARAQHELAVLPDGPRGPLGVVAPGVVLLASRSGVPIFPTSWSATRSFELGTWDRFRVPLPWSTVTVRMAPPVEVPRRASKRELEAARLCVQEVLFRLAEEADGCAWSRPAAHDEAGLVAGAPQEVAS